MLHDEFAGGGPMESVLPNGIIVRRQQMEGKDPDEVIEQLKTGVKKALENTDQTKLSLIEGIINFEEDGDAEMAGLRVAAIARRRTCRARKRRRSASPSACAASSSCGRS